MAAGGDCSDALQERVWLAPRDEPSLAPLLARRLNTANSTAVIETTLDASLQRRLEELLLGWRCAFTGAHLSSDYRG